MDARTSSVITRFLPFLFLIGLPVASATAQSRVTIHLESTAAQAKVPPNFIGLSFEIEKVLPANNGSYYFSPSNKPLLRVFSTLGVRSLRVGGNTADRPTVAVPEKQDIDTLFAFAKAAGVKVIYTVRLRGGDPQRAAETVKYIMNRYPSEVECIAIGNEPNVFSQEYRAYREEWQRYVDLITSSDYAPGSKFCGPNATPGKAVWSRDFANDVGQAGRLSFIAQHAYPGGSGLKVASPEAGIDSMLSLSWVRLYREFHDTFAPDAKAVGLTYRIEETNNFFHAGAAGVSNTFAAALWGLDYLHWWALQGAAGMNFHTGDSVAAGDGTRECYYAVFTASAAGYTVRPLGYAVKAFELGSRGRVVPARIVENRNSVNITAYGIAGEDGNMYISFINKEHGPASKQTTVELVPDASFTTGEVMFLMAPDVAALSGVTLGGAEIEDNGTWNGTWMPLAVPKQNGMFTVQLPPASAAVVRLRH